ncbi:calcium-binding protein [Streptomyces sp. NPDC046900]|uniref:calcium-binding protein n=1 Tax=Streptomyces sp. NPDC046900 TaxID=3155473 RepID=UPI0033FD2B62
MRIRAAVAAVSGALALSALALPAAQADEIPGAALAPFSGKAPADEIQGDTAITKVVVNAGKDIVLGTTSSKTITVTVTATDPSDIADGYAMLWHGTSLTQAGIDGLLAPSAENGTCTAVSATTSTCKVSIVVDPRVDLYKNALAGTWKVWAAAAANDGDFVVKEAYSTAKVKRAAKVTVNASPEPVRKGGTLTVTGKLSRANWETHDYRGYAGQSVQLQFRKKGATAYTTVRTVKSSSTGTLKTTITASVDGYSRFSFAGTSTTGTAVAAGDFVDVS